MRRVTVDAPTRSRIAPKLGTVSAVKSSISTDRLLKAHLFTLKSKVKNVFFMFAELAHVDFTRRYSQHSLEKLSWRVCDDREGGNQVKEQHDLHQDLHPAGRHGQHDVVLHEVTEREITTSGNRDVKKEQN